MIACPFVSGGSVWETTAIGPVSEIAMWIEFSQSKKMPQAVVRVAYGCLLPPDSGHELSSL